MENDDKIKVETQETSLAPVVKGRDEVELRGMLEMLHNLIQDFQEKNPYNLEAEFTKTGRNKNFLIPITVFVTLLLFGAGLVGATMLIVKRYKDVALSIGSFEDLRLKDLLSEASRNQADMERAGQTLADLQAAMTEDLNALKRSTDHKIELLDNEKPVAADKDERVKAFRAEEAAAAASIRAKYQPQIDKVRSTITDIQSKIDAYDARLVEQARKQEKQLDNQKVLFEIEKKKIVSGYEERLKILTERSEKDLATEKAYRTNLVSQLKQNHADEIAKLKQDHANEIAALINKYNPDLSTTPAAKYLAVMPPAPAAVRPVPYRDILRAERILEKSGLDSIQEDSTAVASILSVLNGVPYEVSIRNAIQNLIARSARLGTGYESLWTSLSDALESKANMVNDQAALLRRYIYAFEYQTGTSRENGYIIDPRNPKDILVYMDPRRPVSDGSAGYIFRSDEEFIGTVRFKVSNGEVRAVLDSLVKPDVQPVPFDKLLLRID